MTFHYPKTNKVEVKVTLDQLVRMLADADTDIPKGLPTFVRLSLSDVLELTWEVKTPPAPF